MYSLRRITVFFYFILLSITASGSNLYRLPAGARDMQAPHFEDEVYFVVSGRAKLKVAGKEHEVTAGKILYVRATSEHTFFNIEEDLTLVAVFGPTKSL